MRAATLTGDVESVDGLDVAMCARRQIARTEASQYDAILSYLDAAGAEPLARSGGVNEWTSYGGSGTPQISEFVAAEIGPALGLTANSGRRLIADALDLAYRLPHLFACLHDGSVDAWRVRKVASATREFTIAQAGEADRRLSAANIDGQPLLARLPWWRIRQVLDQIRIVETPDDDNNDRQNAKARRDVSVWPDGDGDARISGTLSAADGQRLAKRLEQIVESLRFLGDTRPHGMLRSIATGMLAEPDSLDDLYNQVTAARSGETISDDADPTPEASATPTADPADPADAGSEPEAAGETGDNDQDRSAGAGGSTEQPGTPVPDAFRRPPSRLPKTVLYVHFDRTWGTYSADGIGAITRTEAADILAGSQVSMRPVIDLETVITATGYVASPRLKEQTALHNGGTCTFPSCDRPARACDYDHIVNHCDGGPTDSHNGHRLCRYHHRSKTFTDWSVSSPAPGVWIWTSPGGRTYLVTGGTTTRLPGRVPPTRHRRKQSAA